MRLVPTKSTRGHRPFTGQGASLYVGLAAPTAIAFRRLRAWPAGGSFTQGPTSAIGGTNTQKSARVASVSNPTASIPYTLPGTFASQTVFAQVRTYKDDVENETNFRPVRIELNGSLANVTTIHGTARLLRAEQRDGGIVRIRFQYFPVVTGLQPLLFRILRTAGPTSPASVTTPYAAPTQIYEIDTPALSDASPYTYTVRAENGATTLDLLTGISITADATGPTVPTSGTAAAW